MSENCSSVGATPYWGKGQQVKKYIYSVLYNVMYIVLNYPFKTLCLFIKLLLFSSLSYHYGLIFILLFALIFIHSCIVYGKT